MMMIINNIIMMYRYVPLPLYAFPIYTEWVNIIIKEWWNVVDGQKLNWREYFLWKNELLRSIELGKGRRGVCWRWSSYWMKLSPFCENLGEVTPLPLDLFFKNDYLLLSFTTHQHIFLCFFSLGLMYICTKFCTPYRPPPPLHSFVLHSFGIEQFLVW